MKKISSFLGIICLIVPAVGLSTSCGSSKDDPVEEPFLIPKTKFSLTTEQLKNVAGSNDLSFRLFSTAYSNQSFPNSWKPITYDVNNLSLSPFGIQLVEAIIINQVSDHTVFLKMAGFREGADLNDYYGTIVSDLKNKRNDNGAVLLSNALVSHPMAEDFRKSYKSLLKSVYNTPVYIFSEAYSEEVAPWNKWTKEQTEGIIDKVPSEVSLDYIYTSRVSSAACFRSSWKPGKDGKNLFYDGDKFSSASLLLGDGSYMLTILLPNQGSGVKDVIDNLTAQSWEDIRINLKWKKSSVSVPEIKVSSVYEHLSYLMESDFKDDYINQVDKEAIIEGDEPTYILFSSQSTSLSIKEDTSTASVGASGDIAPFVANRPFVYLVSETGSGLVLFIGSYMG